MRCLRAITTEQQTGSIYLSEENLRILDEELEGNFKLSVDEFRNSGKEGIPVEVRLVPPPVKIKLKRISKLHQLEKKTVRHGVDLELAKADTERYRIIHRKYKGLDLTQLSYKEDVSYIREQREFSELTLVAEVSRYLNKPPVLIASVLRSTQEGIPAILKAVNEFNELLYDHIIPRLFAEFYNLKAFSREDNYEVELVKVPDNETGCYRVTGKPGHIANYQTDPYAARAGKSFHLDNYCFDSKPEIEFFWKCLEDKTIEKIWFTGMLTHGQSEFCIAYIDPISHTLRQYYPDFLVRQTDGTYVIVEIKGDNMIDDLIVKAKQDYATQQAIGSGFTYRLIPGSQAKSGLTAKSETN